MISYDDDDDEKEELDHEDDSIGVGDDLDIFIDRHQLVHLVLQSLNAIVHCSDPLHDDHVDDDHGKHNHDDNHDNAQWADPAV